MGTPGPRRIAFVSYHTSPADDPGVGDAGGMNVYIDRLARALAAQGVRIDLFTRARGGRLVVEERTPGVCTVAVPAGPARTLAKEELTRYAPSFAVEIACFARRRSAYDIVHSHYWQSGIAAIPLARLWRIPLVHSHHTLGDVKNQTLTPGETPEPALRLQAERRVIAAADLITASTEQERRWVGGPNVRTLVPGVDHALFHPGDRAAARRRLQLADEPVVLAVGRIQPLKGLGLAIRALALLDRRTILLVVGGPSGRDGEAELRRLRALATNLGVDQRVRFVGACAHADLPELYRAADALVVCSHSESFGLAALEAHACGTPVVGMAVGGLATFVREGESGFLLDRRDPVLLADRLASVVAGVCGDTMRRCAAASAAAFSWDATAEALLAHYRRLQQATIGRSA